MTGTQAGVWSASPALCVVLCPFHTTQRGRTAGLSTAAPVSLRMAPRLMTEDRYSGLWWQKSLETSNS